MLVYTLHHESEQMARSPFFEKNQKYHLNVFLEIGTKYLDVDNYEICVQKIKPKLIVF
jgi:hypothetical protein